MKLRIAAVLLLALLAGCHDGSNSSDGGPSDAGGSDGGALDAGQDAGPTDAGPGHPIITCIEAYATTVEDGGAATQVHYFVKGYPSPPGQYCWRTRISTAQDSWYFGFGCVDTPTGMMGNSDVRVDPFDASNPAYGALYSAQVIQVAPDAGSPTYFFPDGGSTASAWTVLEEIGPVAEGQSFCRPGFTFDGG